MNKYLVQYSMEGIWIPFQLLSHSIYEALEWVHNNVQRVGVCVSLIDEVPTIESETLSYWSEQRIIERAIARARRATL